VRARLGVKPLYWTQTGDETAIAREMAAEVQANQDILTVSGTQLYEQLGRTRWPTERSIQFVAANRPAQAKAKANPLGWHPSERVAVGV